MLRLSQHFKPNPQKTKPYSVTVNGSTTPILSTVHRGNQFEERSILLLEKHLSMSLKRIGGKGDGGVDMFGWWWLPSLTQGTEQRRRIRVIGQCKAEKKKLGPHYVRELEGVLHRYHMSSLSSSNSILQDIENPNASSHIPAVGILISESAFTKATILQAQSSSIPMLLLRLPPEVALSSSSDNLATAVWNFALAGNQGLLGGHLEIRWERSLTGSDRPGLWWKNEKLLSWIPSDE